MDLKLQWHGWYRPELVYHYIVWRFTHPGVDLPHLHLLDRCPEKKLQLVTCTVGRLQQGLNLCWSPVNATRSDKSRDPIPAAYGNRQRYWRPQSCVKCGYYILLNFIDLSDMNNAHTHIYIYTFLLYYDDTYVSNRLDTFKYIYPQRKTDWELGEQSLTFDLQGASWPT